MLHVKSHRGNRWNGRADELADQGGRGTVWSDSPRWLDWPKIQLSPLETPNTREADRIIRATDAFGALNSIPIRLDPSSIETLYRRSEARLYGDTHPRAREAASRIFAARSLLKKPDAQKKLRDSLWGRQRPTTRTLRCAVDTIRIKQYIGKAGPDADLVPNHKDGTPYGCSKRQMMRDLLACVTEESFAGMGGFVDLTYRHSRLAERLIAAGHITESREYAMEIEKDPFRLPRTLRKIAIGRSGKDFDDKAAFPYAKMALVGPCKNAVRRFLNNREAIMTIMGNYLLPDTFILGRNNLPPPGEERDTEIKSIRRDGMKALFNSLDMDGSYRGWRLRQGIPEDSCPIDLLVIRLPDNSIFDFRGYVNSMQKGSTWLANRLPAMEALIKQWLRATGDHKRLETAERTLASYIFQEKEGISRGAKIAWCQNRGHRVHNLQHDGIIIQLCRNESTEDARSAIEKRCLCALGYCQPVTADK